MTPPRVGMGVIPLHEAIDAEDHALVRAALRPQVAKGKFGRKIVLFSVERVDEVTSTRHARKVASSFHRRHHPTLRKMEEGRAGQKLVPFSGSEELSAYFDTRAGQVAFDASSGEPLGTTWTAVYVLQPPYAAVTAVYLSSVFLGE